jgi:hypothetical protein
VTDALSQVKTYAYAKDDRLSGITYTSVNPTPTSASPTTRTFRG